MSHDMVKGAIVALITPFNEDGSVNFDKLKELVEFQIANHTDGILVLGTTGESSTMSHEEDDSVVRFVIDTVNKRVPVIVGAGSNNTAVMKKKSIDYENMGADQLLLISPYYNKTNEQGMIEHFKTVADAVSIPIILYNIPGRTGCSISEQAVKILSQHPNIKGIKEASGNLSYAMNISKYLNEDFVMYSGNDDIIVPMLSIGASGVISVLSNVIPQETHDLVAEYLNGDPKKALEIQQKYLDLIHALFIEVNPIPVKEAMNQMGMNIGGYRLPLTEMSPEHKELMHRCLKEVNLA